MVTYHVTFEQRIAYLLEAKDAIDAISLASELHCLATGKSIDAVSRMTVQAYPYRIIEASNHPLD